MPMIEISDIMALAALVVAIISAGYTYKARQDLLSHIHIEPPEYTGRPYFSKKDERWKYLSYFKLSLTNRGGRDASLIRVEPYDESVGRLVNVSRRLLRLKPLNKTLSFLMAIKKDRTIDLNPNINYSVFLTEKKLFDFDEKSKKALFKGTKDDLAIVMDSYLNQGFERLSAININIKPGETKYLGFGMILDCYEPIGEAIVKNDIDKILLMLRLKFNNKQDYVFRQCIENI